MGFCVDYYLALILTGSQLWSYSVCQWFPAYNIYTCPSVTVQRGLCVHVPCSFTVPRGVQLSIFTTGIWYNDYEVAALKDDLVHQTNGRFFLTGNVASGDCSYSIEDPLPIDEEIYYFSVEDGPIKFLYSDSQTYVDVTELTDKPAISSTRLVDGEEVTLTCTSPGKCWSIRPQITWEGTMTDIRQKRYYTRYRDGSRTFHSDITFTPRKSHNNSPLSCRVTLKPDLSTVEKRTLNVEYFPSIKITRGGDDTDDITAVDVKDGDSITMKCIVDSNPKASITWYKEDKAVQRTIRGRTLTLTLINVTPGDAGRYQCTAENEHGAAHRTVEVIYHNFLSIKITRGGDDTDDITAVDVKDGDSITMKCIVDSNPKASITWYKEDMEVQRTISDRTLTLTLINITRGDAGRYQCTAENEHGAAHRTVEIIYHNFPSIKITRGGDDTDDITAVDVKDGDSITMKCIVDSNPKASITWYKEDMEVQRTISGRTLTLTLINITRGDAGRYQCIAENEHGAAHRTVEVIYHNGESNHIIYIILLSTIGTICLLLIALLAFVCWRKRQKKTTSAEMESTYTDLRRSAITSIYDQLKPEVPTDTNVIGSDVVADIDYENVQKKNVSK